MGCCNSTARRSHGEQIHRACPRISSPMIQKCGVCEPQISAGLAGLQLVGLVLMNKCWVRELR